MTRIEQIEFIDSLTCSVITTIKEKVLSTSATEDWDGHNLRHYIALKFQEQITKMNHKQKKEFNNTVLVENL